MVGPGGREVGRIYRKSKPGRTDPIPERRRVSDSAAKSSDEVADQASQFILQGDISGALCLFKSHLTEHPFDSKILELVESLLSQPHAGHGLVEFFRDLQKSAPDDWRAVLNLARAYSKTGKDSLAVVQLQKLLRSESDCPEVWMELAGCYKRLDKVELALRALNSLIDLKPDYAPAHVERVRMLLDSDDLEEATAASVFSLEVRDLPEVVRNWLDKVNLQLEQGLLPSLELLEVDPLSPDPVAPPDATNGAASPPAPPSGREKTQQLLSFTMSMAILVKGGLSFGRIFGILANQHRGGPISSVLHHVEKAVIHEGESLSKALARHPEVFSDHFLAMVEMGESTNLSRFLDRLSEQLKLEYMKGEPRHEAWPALVLACRNLVDALESGGSEAHALAWASRACLEPNVRRALKDLEQQVHSGSRLAECTFPPLFTPLFPNLIAAHEAVGTTASAFKDLARLLGS